MAASFLGRLKPDRGTLTADLIAGLTLGVESIPDAMASGMLAAVNPLHGLYAVMVATPVGALFTSSVFMSVQTTSATPLVVAGLWSTYRGDDQTAGLFMLTLLVGIFMLALGLLKLGTLKEITQVSDRGIAVFNTQGRQLQECNQLLKETGMEIFNTDYLTHDLEEAFKDIVNREKEKE